jgi:PPOX class probable F420-dependent enzyme
MSQRMSRDEAFSFLAQGARTGKLATIRKDGSPHVVPIWFVLDGDVIVFNAGRDTLKGKAMRRDPRVSICVDDERPPFSYVRVDGVAELSEDLQEMLPWSTKIAERYMGAGEAEAFGKRNAVEGEMLIRVRPTKIVALKAISD